MTEEIKTQDAAKKIKLQFVSAHTHNGKKYVAGDTDHFTQKDADAIRNQGTAKLADTAAALGDVANAPISTTASQK